MIWKSKKLDEDCRIYGGRKIKEELDNLGYKVSRRRIGRITKEQGLVSEYTMAQFKPQKSQVNEDVTTNTLNREFDNREELEVVVSDLTYVRVCLLYTSPSPRDRTRSRMPSSA